MLPAATKSSIAAAKAPKKKKHNSAVESGARCDDDVVKCFEQREAARCSAGMIVVVNGELARVSW